MLVRTCAAPTVSRGCPALIEREVDELFQRLPQRLGRVVAGVVGAEWHMGAEKGAQVRLEEAGDAGRERRP